jgi:hypothetical protein
MFCTKEKGACGLPFDITTIWLCYCTIMVLVVLPSVPLTTTW